MNTIEEYWEDFKKEIDFGWSEEFMEIQKIAFYAGATASASVCSEKPPIDVLAETAKFAIGRLGEYN